MLERTLRLLVLLPSFAEAEKRQADGIVTRLNARLKGNVRIEIAGNEGDSDQSIECDAIVSLLRPRLSSDRPIAVGSADDPSSSGTSRLLSTIDRRPPGTPFPDIYIYRYVDPAQDSSVIDENWQRGKEGFAAWVKSKGGKLLVFQDFSSSAEFGARLGEQLLSWPVRLGIPIPEKTPEPPPKPEILAETPVPVQEAAQDLSPALKTDATLENAALNQGPSIRSNIVAGAQTVRIEPPHYTAKRNVSRFVIVAFAVFLFLFLASLFAWQLRDNSLQNAGFNPILVIKSDLKAIRNFAFRSADKTEPSQSPNDLKQGKKPGSSPTPGPANSVDGLLQQSKAAVLIESSKSFMAQGNATEALPAATEAKRLFQSLSTSEPNATAALNGLMESNRIIGDAQLALSHADEALAAYGDSLIAAKAMTLKEPDNVSWQKDLSISYEKISKLLTTQKRLDDAVSALRESLAIRQGLVQKNPANIEFQRNLSATQERLGDLMVLQGHLDEGLAAYRDGLATRKALALKDMDNSDLRHDFFESKTSVGDALAAQGRLEDALSAYRDAISDASAMASKYPDDTGWQRAFAISDEKIGDVLAGLRRFDDALAAYRESMVSIKALAAKEPDSNEWQSLTSTGNERIGDVFVMENHLDSAVAAYRDDLAVMKALAIKDPQNSAWQLGLSESQERIGDVLNEQGHADAALASYRESIAIIRSLAQKEPDNMRWQRNLMVAESKVGQLLMSQGHRADALAMYRDAESIAIKWIPKDTANPNWQNSQAMIDSNIGALLMALNRHDEAISIYRDAFNIAKTLAQKNPGNIEWQISFVISLYNLADAGEDSANNLNQALDILKRLDAAGTLPPDKKGLIANIEGKLAKVKHRAPVIVNERKK